MSDEFAYPDRRVCRICHRLKPAHIHRDECEGDLAWLCEMKRTHYGGLSHHPFVSEVEP
jgi:hypothetical protein